MFTIAHVKTVAALATIASLVACGGSSGLPEVPVDDPEVIDTPVVTDPDVVDIPVVLNPQGEVERRDVRESDRLFPYRSDSPYAAVLKGCALTESVDTACDLTTLPFVKQAKPEFTRDDVLDRLLVTHEWMGERFEVLIDDAPDSMIPLFGSITAISIGSTIRPSYYWTGTGAIQLDPENLWLTVEEKANVSIEEDFRSGFGADLQFWGLGSLRDGGEPAIRYFNLTDTNERSIDDVKIPMYRLLYHELAHAVDYLPDASVPSLDASLTPNKALNSNREFFLSPKLVSDLPLYSQTLFDLAQVRFRGVEATEFQKTITPSDVGAEMAIDGAMRYYAYSTDREDFATLFTLAMMKYEFGFDYYIGYVQKPVDEDNYDCSELVVGWGTLDRLADPLVNPRAKWVFEQIYGTSDATDEFFASGTGVAVPMTPGLDWCTNRDGAVQTDSALAGRSIQQPMTAEQLQAQFVQLERERRERIH